MYYRRPCHRMQLLMLIRFQCYIILKKKKRLLRISPSLKLYYKRLYHRMLYLFIRPQFHIAILTCLSSPVITPVEMPCHRMQLLMLIRFQCYIILKKKQQTYHYPLLFLRISPSLKLYYKRLYHRMLYIFIRPQFHIAILMCLSSPVITPVDKTPGVI